MEQIALMGEMLLLLLRVFISLDLWADVNNAFAENSR